MGERQGRGGVSVVMEKVALVGGPTRKNKSLNRAAASHSDNYSDRLRAVSHLLIRDASPDIDEGRYTCSPSDGTIEASTTLFVLEEHRMVSDGVFSSSSMIRHDINSVIHQCFLFSFIKYLT